MDIRIFECGGNYGYRCNHASGNVTAQKKCTPRNFDDPWGIC